MDRTSFLLGLTGTIEVAALAPGNNPPPSGSAEAIAPYGRPSSFESGVHRLPPGLPSPALTPLGAQLGIITPSGLHFVRNHAGIPALDPRRHTLTIHGMVQRPLAFTLADLQRFPAHEAVHFLECSGNSARGYQQLGTGVQFSHGLVSCTHWTGVRLGDVLQESGIAAGGAWIVAEGADGAAYDVSLPLTALGDALVVYGQNGEMLRPEQGYPMRLLVPGFQGSSNVKWLRRIKVVPGPIYSREETAQYAQADADGKIRLFDFVMETKSVVTFPSPGIGFAQPGAYAGRGFAWSGRGRIKRVEVTLDDGATWIDARLDDLVLPQCFTRFTFPIAWDGRPFAVASRATDEHGDVQPTLGALIAKRGRALKYHVNAIAPWRVAGDGSVSDPNA